MSRSESRHPKAATCEDWDEKAQTVLPGSRTSAHVSKKTPRPTDLAPHGAPRRQNDGVHPGYGSRQPIADLTDSFTNGQRRMPESKPPKAPGVPERERQPYGGAQKTSKSTAATPQAPQPAQAGRATVCDKYGRHVDHIDRRTSATKPTATRYTVDKASKNDHSSPPKVQRSSSTRQQPPPLSILPHGGLPNFSPSLTTYTTAVLPSWHVSASPLGPPIAYTYLTPQPPQIVQYPIPYAEPGPRPAQFTHRPNRPERSQTLSEPLPADIARHGHRYPDRLEEFRDAPSFSAAPRQAPSADRDRERMPLPARPHRVDDLPRRPSHQRSQTYDLGKRVASERALERDRTEEYHTDPHGTLPPSTAHRPRRGSPTRPPNSYKGPTYVRPSSTTKVASSKGPQVTRRTADSDSTLEQKAINAEEYQRQHRSEGIELTAEALRNFNHRDSKSRSETGSSHSRVTRQSSSKGSSHGRSLTTNETATSINVSGVALDIPSDYFSKDGRPVQFTAGDLQVSVSSIQDSKPVERADSTTSKASKRSVASTRAHLDRDVADPPRGSSRPDDRSYERPSRRHSISGRETGRARHQSVDYVQNFRDRVYGA